MSREGREQFGPQIGATLLEARRRLGLDVREVEERTKIRARYIRALENEDWETLPAPAYVRGFLRTYGQLLGLDGEMLADEYRRRTAAEEPLAGPAPAEPVLSERRPLGRRPLGRRPPSRGPLIGALVVALVGLLLALGLLGGGDDTEPTREPTAKERRELRQERREAMRRAQRRRKRANQQAEPAGKSRRVNLTLTALTPVEVCLIADGDDVLIEQVIDTGNEESFERRRRYRLDLVGGGEVRLLVGGERRRIDAPGPVSFEADSRGIEETEFKGPDCP